MVMGLVMIDKEAHVRLGRLIDEAINQANKSTKDVADEMGVHQETVRRWRKGDRVPTRIALHTLSTLLGFDPNEALLLHAQAKVESEEGDLQAGMVLPPRRVSEELLDLRARVSELEDLLRTHIDNH